MKSTSTFRNAVPTPEACKGLQRFSLTAVAASLLLASGAAAAAPGAAALEAWNITSQPHGFVEIDTQSAGSKPYKDLVKINKKVNVPLPFNVYGGDPGVKAVALVDGVVDPSSEIRLSDSGAKKGVVIANVKTAGKKSMQVRIYDAEGNYTDSAPLTVTVFDTIPELADDLPDNVDPRNKKFVKNSDGVVGTYFTTWSIYDRHFSLDKVPLDNLTHLLYGFVPICGADVNEALRAAGQPYNALVNSCQGLPDYSIAIHDSWGELGATLPGQSYGSSVKGVMGQMMAAKKKKPDLKILPSIGGWTLSDPFFRLHDANNRKVFVDSVEAFLRTWKFFDGVDIDWEFPGGKGATPSNGNAQTDGQLYVTLMKELRQMLERLSKEYGKQYQLTSAIGSPPEKVNVVDYKAATQYMDYLFDMTYDYYGAWDNKELGHQTALHAPRDREAKFTTDRSVKALLDQGVDSKKIVVGVAKYGRGWTGVSGYKNNDPFTGHATGPHAGQWEKGILDYKKIVADMLGPNGMGINGYEYNYDQDAEAPYVFNKSTGDLVTFDDARSTHAKGNYVRQHQLGGLFSWEIDADNGDILNAMNESLGNATGGDASQQPPKVLTSPILNVSGAQTVSLDASRSLTPGGGTLIYEWEQVSGHPLTINQATSAIASISVPAADAETRYVFRVTVTDKAGRSDSAQVVVLTQAKSQGGDAGKSDTGKGDSGKGDTGKSDTGKGDSGKGDTGKTDAGKDDSGKTYPAYAAGTQYKAGDIVSNVGNLYQCKPFPNSGWCSISPAAYEPGKGWAWNDAWNLYASGDTGSQDAGKGDDASKGQDDRRDQDSSKGQETGKGQDTGKGQATAEADDSQYPAYAAGTTYKAGDIVANHGKVYQCKPFPYAGWCSMAGWAYEPGKGSAWTQAWEEYKR